MDLQEAVKSYSSVVIASDLYGKYVGSLVSCDRVSHEFFKCKICVLAVLQYPSQKAILQRTIKERKPYDFQSTQEFYLGDINTYSSNMPLECFDQAFYDTSRIAALVDKIQDYGLADDPEKQILLNHLDEVRGVPVKQHNVIYANFNQNNQILGGF